MFLDGLLLIVRFKSYELKMDCFVNFDIGNVENEEVALNLYVLTHQTVVDTFNFSLKQDLAIQKSD